MARTLTEIEAGAQFHARDNQLSLTNTHGLALANRIHRRLVLSLEWPEYLIEDTTLTTTADGLPYTWPASAPASILTIEVEGTHGTGSLFGSAVFGQDLFGAGTEEYRIVTKPPSERMWSDAGKEPSTDWPWYYRRTYSAGDLLELRPTPSTAGKSIRIRGLSEPAAFLDGSSTTTFIDSAADDALEKLIAAEYAVREVEADVVDVQRAEANALLSQLFNRQIQVV